MFERDHYIQKHTLKLDKKLNIMKPIILLTVLIFSSLSLARTVSDILSQYDTHKQIEFKAAQGNAQAQYDLGSLYGSNHPSSPYPFNQEKWFELNMRAADQGLAAAQHSYGLMESIYGLKKEAFKWYKKAAEQGHAESQSDLGHAYKFGIGTLRDDKEAVKWFRKAAEQGNVNAQYYLGLMYEDKDRVVLKDDKEAVKWFRKAAEQGHVNAQHTLGLKYVMGQGVLKNLSEARYWIKKAYENLDADTSEVKSAKKIWNKFEMWKY